MVVCIVMYYVAGLRLVPKQVHLARNNYCLVRAAAQLDWAGLEILLETTVSHLRV